MRKAIFLFFLLLGVGAGYLSARNDDWGLCIVMMAVGALFGGGSAVGCRRSGNGTGRLPPNRRNEPIPWGNGNVRP